MRNIFLKNRRNVLFNYLQLIRWPVNKFIWTGNIKNLSLFILFNTLLSITVTAQLSIAKIFGNHMVLQQAKPVTVWGWAANNEKIIVSINHLIVKAKANNNGNWILQLPAMKAGGPYTMMVNGSNQKIKLEDIMIGEVWICSGQSNMEFSLNGAYGYEKELDSVPGTVRHFKVPHELSLRPAKDLKGGEWITASKETISDFSAVGYYFAKELARKLNVTVGLINASWGGSQVEGWMSKESLITSKELHDAGITAPVTWDDVTAQGLKRIATFMQDNPTGKFEPPSVKDVLHSGYSFDAWKNMYAPGSWDWAGLFAYRGQGYMQRYIDVTESEAALPSVLNLGTNNSKHTVIINGKIVSQAKMDEITLHLPAGTWKPGRNTVILKQGAEEWTDWHDMGIYGGGEKLFLSFEKHTISLADDKWKMMPATNEPFVYARLCNSMATGLYNGMMHPLIPYSIKGFLWYQGEANTGRAYQYRVTFPEMIKSWRNEWKEVLPFLFVQLSSYGGDMSSNEGSEWAELREAQSMALALPETGMAVTIDVGNPGDIHPKNKADVGKRLAANAFKKVYGLDVPFCGPVYKSADFINSKAVISFDYCGSGLMIKDKYGYPKAFEIAGADKIWHYAKASVDENTIIVWSDEVKEPVAVRYAWTDAPAEANLFNKEGLPASPFRTDNWKGITEGKKFQ